MESSFFNFRKVFPLLFLIWSAHLSVDLMLGIWPVYKSLSHLDLATAGLIVAIGAFIGEGAQLIFGLLSDKGYQKQLICLGLVGAIAPCFFCLSNHYGVLFALYLCTCLGSGCFHPAAASLASQLDPTRRTFFLAIFASGGSIGLAFSQLIFVTSYHAFEGAPFLLAIPSILIACFAFYIRFPDFSLSTHSSFSLKNFMEFFKTPSLRALYLCQVANQSILWGTVFILPDVLKALGHPDWICYGGGHLCLILGGGCMMFPMGYLAYTYPARLLMLWAGGSSVCTFYFILFTGGISQEIVLLALFILGASLALISPLSLSIGIRLKPDQPGLMSAFLMGLVWCISEVIGPGGVGVISLYFEDLVAVKALAILGGLFLLQIYMTLSLPKTIADEAIEENSAHLSKSID